MDGGKGQVGVAQAVLRSMNLEIPVAGLVKDDRHRTRGIIYENKEVKLTGYNNVLLLLTKIQDEVHRFAISYHRSLRKRTQIHSVLEDIPGIGERRRKNLLLKFGSIEAIRAATPIELGQTPAMDKKSVKAVIDFFRQDVNNQEENNERNQMDPTDPADPAEPIDSTEPTDPTDPS